MPISLFPGKTERRLAAAGGFFGKQQASEPEDLRLCCSAAEIGSAYKLNCHRKVVNSCVCLAPLLETCLPPLLSCFLLCHCSASVCAHTHSCSSSSRLLSALPHLTHFVCHWNKRRAFPACRGKTPLCSLCCHGKVDQAADGFGTTATFQSSSIVNIADIQTIAHRIQTALEAGC